MSVENVAKHPIPAGFEGVHAGPDDYSRMYAESIADPEAFWGRGG